MLSKVKSWSLVTLSSFLEALLAKFKVDFDFDV